MCAEPRTEARPVSAAILRGHGRVHRVRQHDEHALRALAIDGQVDDLPVIEALIRGMKILTGVLAYINARSFDADHQPARRLRMDHQGFDGPRRRRNPGPGDAAVERFPKALGCGGIERLGLQRILKEQVRAVRGRRDAAELGPQGAAALAAVNAGASAGEDPLRLSLVYADTHHVGVVRHSRMDGNPLAAAVGGFPRQMISAGVDDFRIGRINGNRIKVAQVFMVGGGNLLPTLAGILRAEDAPECPGNQNVRVGWRLSQRPDGLAIQADGPPITPAIIAAENAAAVRAQRLTGGVQCGRISGIHDNRHHDAVRTDAHTPKQSPVFPAVTRAEDVPVRDAEIKQARVTGVYGQRPDVAAGRPHWPPVLPAKRRGDKHGKEYDCRANGKLRVRHGTPPLGVRRRGVAGLWKSLGVWRPRVCWSEGWLSVRRVTAPTGQGEGTENPVPKLESSAKDSVDKLLIFC